MYIDDCSIPVPAFSGEEVSALRALGRGRGRGARDFDALASEATRLGFFGAKLIGRLDADASMELEIREAEVLLGLARTPARDVGEYRVKAALFRSWCDGGADDTNLPALLDAALAVDAARLGIPETVQ